jgi:hypothetical protein
MPNLYARNLDYALAGMVYPARYWQILAWADYNCATGELRKALWRLPHKAYVDQRAIVAALSEQPGGVAACTPTSPISVSAHRKARLGDGQSWAHAEIRRTA